MASFGGERSAPNGRVEDVSLESWQRLLELIDRVATSHVFRAYGGDHPVPVTADELFAADQLHGTVRVVLDDEVGVNLFPVDETFIDFDFDTRQLVDQRHLDVLTGFLRLIGLELSRPVVIASEGDDAAVLARYEPDTDTFELVAGGVGRAGPRGNQRPG